MGGRGDNRNKIEFWREEVLRRAEQALQGRLVGLWRTEGDRLVPVAVGAKRELPPTASGEITRALRAWHVPMDAKRYYLAARLDMGRWCIAPVRGDVPAPPPHGVERRKKERMTLELAGLCLGLIEEHFAAVAEAQASEASAGARWDVPVPGADTGAVARPGA